MNLQQFADARPLFPFVVARRSWIEVARDVEDRLFLPANAM